MTMPPEKQNVALEKVNVGICSCVAFGLSKVAMD